MIIICIFKDFGLQQLYKLHRHLTRLEKKDTPANKKQTDLVTELKEILSKTAAPSNTMHDSRLPITSAETNAIVDRSTSDTGTSVV